MLHSITRRAALLAGLLFATSNALAQTASVPLVGGTWRGSYVCLQGKTGLTLTIDSQSNDKFSGYFHFYPPTSNPVAREGCFSVNGRVDGSGRVTIDAESWITRPQGYVTVNLDGKLTGAGRSMRGDVRGPDGLETRCKQFRLDRRSARPEVSGVCRGTIARLREEQAVAD